MAGAMTMAMGLALAMAMNVTMAMPMVVVVYVVVIAVRMRGCRWWSGWAMLEFAGDVNVSSSDGTLQSNGAQVNDGMNSSNVT